MIIQTGGARRVYGGGRRGLGDDSITVTDTAEPIPYDYADISTPPILTYSGDQPNTTDVSNYMNWITGATPAPASPVFFPSSGGSGAAASLTSLAAQIANLFRPTAAAPAASAAQASAAAPAGSAASWFARNQGLVIGGGIGLALLVLMKGGRR